MASLAFRELAVWGAIVADDDQLLREQLPYFMDIDFLPSTPDVYYMLNYHRTNIQYCTPLTLAHQLDRQHIIKTLLTPHDNVFTIQLKKLIPSTMLRQLPRCILDNIVSFLQTKSTHAVGSL